MSESTKVRAIAFYLPQYHPIPENDEWWGKGFTEWTNVTKAKPLFKGHHQPHLPADLGFYDLRLPEARQAQADLARQHGIHGFCYYHYWFNGKRLLERPFNEVIESSQPDFPFCLAWGNQTWSGIWHGLQDKILVEQTYPGKEDYEAHFHSLIKAFTDPRYIKIDDKPVFLIYRPQELPNTLEFTDYWRELSLKVGLKGMYFIAIVNPYSWDGELNGFDGVTSHPPFDILSQVPPTVLDRIARKIFRKNYREFLQEYFSIPSIYKYSEFVQYAKDYRISRDGFFPCICPNWDNTPRSGINGKVIQNSTPELFRIHLRDAIESVSQRNNKERFIFIKSWNEWAEGNYLEPDQKFGTSYLKVLKDEIF